MSQTGQPVSLPDPVAPGPFTLLAEKPKKLPNKLPKKIPTLFKTETISGRYHEWVGDGHQESAGTSQEWGGEDVAEQAIHKRQSAI